LRNIYIANKSGLFKALSLFALSLILISCGGGSSSSSSTDTVVISGKITFDRVPVTEGGLDYTAIVQSPVRRTLVSAVESSSSNILANTYTNEKGEYSFSVPASKSIKLNVSALTQNPIIKVQDHLTLDSSTSLPYRFVLVSPAAFTTESGVNLEKNLNAASGYDSSEKTVNGIRSAAPFAILDTCLKAADFFLANKTIVFPALTLNWSEKNNDITIGTSNWDGNANALYIMGDINQDTDEYDEHIIVHEWGHYFESMVGRSDSIGGSHSVGNVLDPRVAFSEGWGNALSAMVLYPDSVYKDTVGLNQGTTSNIIHMDTNNSELVGDPSAIIGWFSESSVQSILYDMFDPASSDTAESWDNLPSTTDALSTNSDTFYDIFTSNIKNSESFVTLFTFIAGFNSLSPSSSTAVSKLLAKHSIAPVTDAFGSAEVNNGGISGSLPVYKLLPINSQVVLDFPVSTENNQLSKTQYINLSGISGKIDIATTGATFKDLTLYYKGIAVANKNGTGSLTIDDYTFDITRTYILAVTNGEQIQKDEKLGPLVLSVPAAQLTISLTPRN
jgi:hypothetical protein